MDAFHHERIHRGEKTLARMKGFRVVICGAGAIGGNVAENLARAGFETIEVIDFDRVEEHNLSTQPYAKTDIGAKKSRCLANRLYQVSGCRCRPHDLRLDGNNAVKLLRPADIVVDAFDNGESRQIVQDTCREMKIPCLHAGMIDGYSEVVWDENYIVPGNSGEDVCDYPLARNLAVITSSVAAETIIRFVADGVRESRAFTLKDMNIGRH
jgi:molybdopterin/thiamine biosynthesis adenylyltransferase